MPAKITAVRLTRMVCPCILLVVGCATVASERVSETPVTETAASDSTSNESLELAFDPHAAEAAEAKKKGVPPPASISVVPARAVVGAAPTNNCDPKCVAKQRTTLMAEYKKRLKAKDLRGAAKVALKEAHLLASTLPPGEQIYARTPLSEEACKALEAKSGEGQCEKLELELFAQRTFVDFSRRHSGQEGLSRDDVKEVNSHFSPLISECLAARARQLTPPDYERHGLHWTVGNDGRVIRVTMDRNVDEGSELSRCFSEKLAVFRYPRFSGEQQNLSQAFLIQASERRWR